MATQHIIGRTGRSYEFMIADPANLHAIPTAGGVFVFAKPAGEHPKVIYAGESNNLYNSIDRTTLWTAARQEHHATLLLIHPQGEEQARVLVRDDIVAEHQPPMNGHG
ncbi:MAG TPA: hypothetical protein VKS60_12375 [Stellaceae bacterium]|nr:hypothetical protein [Stellaceae bacterium]